jgi:carbamoyl-phosphate synthase small subunit
MTAMLALADGKVFQGRSFGALLPIERAAVGEVVFNTSMYGYQEIMTDPSYAGQIMCFTSPHIGNVGCNPDDDESSRVWMPAVIIRNQTLVTSNFRAKQSLDEYLKRHEVMGLCEVDTRELVLHIRTHGAQSGAMAAGDRIDKDELVDRARSSQQMQGSDYVRHVTTERAYEWTELPWSMAERRYLDISEAELSGRPHLVAIDCGIKRNILRLLVSVGFRVTVIPAFSAADEIMALRPDALFISNGPGDPAALEYIVSPLKELVGKVPSFGICLGHQLLAQAFGAETFKLKFGHRGGNHPVKDFKTGKVEITVQNHGFAVSPEKLERGVTVSHINLNDGTVEGLLAPEQRAFSIQYHPEASPGPHDSLYLFNRFFESLK